MVNQEDEFWKFTRNLKSRFNIVHDWTYWQTSLSLVPSLMNDNRLFTPHSTIVLTAASV